MNMTLEVATLIGAITAFVSVVGIGWKLSAGYTTHFRELTDAVSAQHKEQTDSITAELRGLIESLRSIAVGMTELKTDAEERKLREMIRDEIEGRN
ncbi:MAG: hypothetical protein GKR94_18325 [Gammaproteobacteria bacterium]|nr:hypothetical protein [Gammaproteobacteria bacterium]